MTRDRHVEQLVPDNGALDGGDQAVCPLALAPVEPLAVDADQAAALLGFSRTTFFKLVAAGKIGPAGVHLGKCVRYSLAELKAWAAAGMPPRHEWVARSRGAAGT